MNRYKRIGIYGISCVGKTSIAKFITELNPILFYYVDGSDIIDRVCPGGIEMFKKLSLVDKTNYRIKAIEYIEELQTKIKKHFIIAGHYSFIINNKFEIAWTDADERFYTDIFLIKDNVQRISNRCKALKKQYSKEELNKWQIFEEEKLLLLNKKIYKTSRKNIEDIAMEVYEELNKRIIKEKVIHILGKEDYNVYLLFDADGTIIPYDSAVIMEKYLNDASPQIIKNIFKKYPEYKFEAFLDVAKHYSQHNTKEQFDNASLKASREIVVRKEFLPLLQKENIGKFIISAGFYKLWQYVIKKYNLKNVHIISGNTLYDDYIIGDNEKGIIVKELKKYHKRVISFGDGLVDKYMLMYSDEPYLIINDKYRSINKYILEFENLKYISFSELSLKGIERISTENIIKKL